MTVGTYHRLVALAAAIAVSLFASTLARAQPMPPSTMLAMRSAEVCSVPADGRVLCVGEWPVNTATSSSFGSRNTYVTEPREVIGVRNPVSISVTVGRGCAVVRDGSTWCWGNDTPTPRGWVGADPTSMIAHAVAGLPAMASVAVSMTTACGIDRTGQVWCWGTRLGNIGIAPALAPTAVAGFASIAQLSGGWGHVCGVTTSGTVRCIGENREGQLGSRPTPAPLLTPTTVPGLRDAVEVTASHGYTCARRRTGDVVCWGDNRDGALGTGDFRSSWQPRRVVGLSGVTSIAAAQSSAVVCAVDAASAVRCWGVNYNDVLGPTVPGRCTIRRMMSTFGASDSEYCATPQPVPGLTGIASVAIGAGAACSTSRAGTVVCWGRSLRRLAGHGPTPL